MASPTASRLLSSLLGLLLPTALAVTLLAAPSSVTTDAPPPATPSTGLRPAAQALASPTYQTFTINIKHDLNRTKALADMRRALTLGDAGGMQEMSDAEDRESLIALCKAEDWGWYMPNDGGVAIPIVWNRDRFRLIDGHTVKVHGPQNGVTPSRYINVVRLREIATGKVFGYINTHVISGASRDAQLSNMQRIPRLRLHLKMLRQEIQALFNHTEHVFISGDLNVNYLADRRRQNPGLPTDRLGDLVNFDMPLTGSFNPTSLLDYGMSVKRNGGLVKTDASIVKGFNSDHWAIRFTYRAIDLFETGPLFNAPAGDLLDRRRSLDRTVRAVQDAETGDLVRVATSRLDDPDLLGALTSAYAEGAAVQVVVGAGTPTAAEQQLETALGIDQTQPSWLRRCVGSCLGGTGRQEANFVLVSRAGGTTELAMISSAAFEAGSTSRSTDVFRSSSAAVYATYGAVFSRMSLDTTDTSKVRTVEMGTGYTAQLYPVPALPFRDPVLKALKPVGCTEASGLRTDDGRTDIRVAVQAWSGVRGQRVATRLAALRRKGCDVVVVVGPHVRKGIRTVLADGGVPVRTSAVGQNLLVIDGRHAGTAGAHLAYTGGPGWTDLGVGSDGVTLVASYADAVSDYLDGWSRTWQRGA
ncbi:hypothetical protein [Nocardioides sp.]|uniref:hypothetical protein n=1 Tax=Nocardioides sp. TaxID=35761 RepID=UPI00286B2FCB|nr:hypothetical protein [Nocardioides sp.]